MAPADAAAWLQEHAHLQVEETTFACLEGCGFCCTYPPQVTREGFQAIEQATGLRQIAVDPQGRTRLPLQGGCGGCTLLKDRRCTAYELRPRHCRLFPFHVYFGRQVEVHADRVCPGLDAPSSTTPVTAALAQAVSGVPAQELVAHAEQAREVHQRFREQAEAAGVWEDPDRAREQALSQAQVTEAAWAEALWPFEQEDQDLWPTMVLPGPGFTWRMWGLSGGRLRRLTFREDGSTEEVGDLALPDRQAVVDGGLGPAVVAVRDRLVAMDCLIGSAMDLVDASAYEMPLGEAIQALVDQVTASLALRVPLLEAEEVAVDERWLAAAYEPEFFDLPTIGGWL